MQIDELMMLLPLLCQNVADGSKREVRGRQGDVNADSYITRLLLQNVTSAIRHDVGNVLHDATDVIRQDVKAECFKMF